VVGDGGEIGEAVDMEDGSGEGQVQKGLRGRHTEDGREKWGDGERNDGIYGSAELGVGRGRDRGTMGGRGEGGREGSTSTSRRR
jgi:hypothetical protein